MSRTLVRSALSFLAVLASVPVARGQAPAAPAATDYRALYTKQEVMIPMRDGVHLFTAIYVPKDTTRLHPIVMTRTPYSSGPYGADQFPGVFRGMGSPQLLAYLRAGYIGVFQDVRGRWMSEGAFMDVRPYVEHKHSNQDVDETSDTYDTAEWLIHHVAGNNGRIGVRGTSYPGFYASMAAIDAHPAIKVVSPQAPVTEWMGGDDFMHNGALLLPHAFDFYWGFGWPRPQPTTRDFHPVNFGTRDGYDFFLNKLGVLANVNPRFFHDSVAFWDSIAAHPTWDAFWQARSARPHLKNLRPAMLWVGGWFDTENLWGALHAYAAAEAQSPGAVNRLVMGPWSHGQWNGGTADSLGAMGWGFLTAQVYTDSIEVPFFNYYLLGDSAAPRHGPGRPRSSIPEPMSGASSTPGRRATPRRTTSTSRRTARSPSPRRASMAASSTNTSATPRSRCPTRRPTPTGTRAASWSRTSASPRAAPTCWRTRRRCSTPRSPWPVRWTWRSACPPAAPTATGS